MDYWRDGFGAGFVLGFGLASGLRLTWILAWVLVEEWGCGAGLGCDLGRAWRSLIHGGWMLTQVLARRRRFLTQTWCQGTGSSLNGGRGSVGFYVNEKNGKEYDWYCWRKTAVDARLLGGALSVSTYINRLTMNLLNAPLFCVDVGAGRAATKKASSNMTWSFMFPVYLHIRGHLRFPATALPHRV